MRERCTILWLRARALAEFHVGRDSGQDLDRDSPIEPDVERPIDSRPSCRRRGATESRSARAAPRLRAISGVTRDLTTENRLTQAPAKVTIINRESGGPGFR